MINDRRLFPKLVSVGGSYAMGREPPGSQGRQGQRDRRVERTARRTTRSKTGTL
jgi:hypothetical protein